MANTNSSARIFASVCRGEPGAADELFYRYLQRLSLLARSRLSPRLARRFDPEDVVMSAYRSFFIAADTGRFSIEQSGQLWALLTTITLRKLYRSVAHHSAEKRDLYRDCEVSSSFDLEHWATSSDPSPEEAITLADELETVLALLTTQQRRIIELRLQGEQIDDIAADVGVNEKTVRRTIEKVIADAQARHGFDMDIAVPKSVPVTSPRNAAAVPPFAPLSPASNAPDSLPMSQNLLPCELPLGNASLLLHKTAPDNASPNVNSSRSERSLTSISFDDVCLKQLIGRGGMGKIYRATLGFSQSDIAVKFLHKSLHHDASAIDRFVQEAEVVRRLNHPGIVKLHGLGQTSGGIVFLAMDLVDGQSLQQHRSQRSLSTGSSFDDNLRWVVRVVAGLANAVHYAHNAGVVHCDLKPENVMIDKLQRPILTDFGLACLLRHEPRQHRFVAGTAPWMAPEQVDTSFGNLSAATDVYGLGAILYALLTNEPPFTGTRASDVLSQVISAKPPEAPRAVCSSIPESLELLCLMCLSKNPTQRPASAAEVERSLLDLHDKLSPAGL